MCLSVLDTFWWKRKNSSAMDKFVFWKLIEVSFSFVNEILVADMFSVSTLFYYASVLNKTRISKICVWHGNCWQRANMNCSWNNIHNQCHVSRSISPLLATARLTFSTFNANNILLSFIIELNSYSCKQPRRHRIWTWDRFARLGSRLLASIREGSISWFLCATRTTQERICCMVGETIR